MRRALLLLALLLAPLGARAQAVASLVADNVTVEGRTLSATGNVEVFHDGTRLSAAAITYDRSSERLTIDGPIYIVSPRGDITTATRAELDPQLENGILRGARLVLDRQLQLAANRLDRREGRYTQLYRTAATSCRVCGDRPPLWEIRAERIILDDLEQQLYFENATLRLGGLPVAWIPAMRLPGPTVERATGLLVPRLRSTDRLGLGIKLPYFIALGGSRDLLLTPYLSPQTGTLEARYRQAYLRGDVLVEGAVTRDAIRDRSLRAYVFAGAEFAYPNGWQLSGQLQTASDDSYLLDYDFSDTDRLDTFLRLRRIDEDGQLSFGITAVESLREGDDNDALPSILPRAEVERVIRDPALPGTITLGASADAAIRRSGEDGSGRDVARLGASADWSGRRVLPGGLLAEIGAGLAVDAYAIGDDNAFGSAALRALPYARAELRWPLVRTGTGGATHVLEPVIALTWSEASGDPVPNEDSTVVELDEANLYALSRFPGEDARETGLRAAAGLSYAISWPEGREATLTAGRLFRNAPDPRFGPGTGLVGESSDWLLSLGLDLPSGLSLDARGLFDQGLGASRAEARLAWRNPRVDLSATYILLTDSPSEGRSDAVNEWTLDGAYRVNDIWALSGEARYDVAADEPQSAGLGVEYSNECITVGLSVSRRFTSSTTLEPETDYGLRIALSGFSAGRAASAAPQGCRN